MSGLKMLNGEAAAEAYRASAAANRDGKHEIVAFFSSALNAVTTDPIYFNVPLDDHMCTRGHAVFDTANINGGKVYGLDFHLDRLLRSAASARIDLSKAEWLSGVSEKEEVKAKLKEIILCTVAASGMRDGVYCRYWMSAARGDFAISPGACKGGPGFYVVIHRQPTTEPKAEGPDLMEDTIVSIPLKGKTLATLKSNNYLVNALCAMEAQERTGKASSLGLQLDSDGNLAEFSIGSIAVIGEDGIFKTPKQDKILRSTTLARSMDLAKEHLIPQGLLKGVDFADISVDELKAAKEILEVGGGNVRSIVRLDNRTVGDGQAGPVATALYSLIDKEQTDSVFTDAVPYDLYST